MNISLNTNPCRTTTFNELKIGDAFILASQYEVGAEITFEEIKTLFKQTSRMAYVKVIYDTSLNTMAALCLNDFIIYNPTSYPVIKLQIKNIELTLPQFLLN